MSYGYTVKIIIELYRLGIRKAEDITEENVKAIMEKTKGISRKHVWQSYLREQSKKLGKPIIDGTLDGLWNHDKIVCFDSEYVDADNVVIYGFLIESNVYQFNMTQTKEVKELLIKVVNDGYKIFHYGGSDKKILLSLLDVSQRMYIEGHIINVLEKIKKQIGMPVESLNLHVVAKYLKDHIESEKDNDGLDKSEMCMTILELYKNEKKKNFGKKDFRKLQDYKNLLKTNEQDIFDLRNIINEVKKLS